MSRAEQLHGQGLEDFLSYAHGLYFARHQVWVRHNGIAGVWRKRQGKAVFTPTTRQAAPDYYGCIKGRFVAFDAKTTKDDTWRLPRDREHQYHMLRDLAAAGALCWFAIEHRPAQTMHLLKIHEDSPYPGLRFDEALRPIQITVPLRHSFGGYDWLAAVTEHWL